MANIPEELIRYIIEYIDDIDIRREFNVYNRIDMSKYRLPIGCTFIHVNAPTKYYYNIPNLYDFEERKEKKVVNDFIEVRIMKDADIIDESNTILYYIAIYRLKPKTLKKNQMELELFYSKINEYYWDYRIFSYCRT